MKKISLISFLLIMLSIGCFAQSKDQNDSLRDILRDPVRARRWQDSTTRVLRQKMKQDSTKMTFIVKSNSGEFKTDKILLNLEFKNISDEDIKILEPFDEDTRAFFYLNVYCETGYITPQYYNSLMVYNSGFIDYPAFYKYKYIEIPKGKSYKHTINLTEIIKSTYDNLLLPKGRYRVEMAYTNFKGNGCVIGTFKSEDVKFTVVE